MQHFHRSPQAPRIRRISLTVAQLVGATAAVTIAAGTATAESLSREDGNSGRPGASAPGRPGVDEPNRAGPFNHRPGKYEGDTTGAHHIDPYGFHHRDSNPVLQNQHRNPGSERVPAPQSAPRTGAGGQPTTWTPIEGSDGGWAVCRPHATWC
ncbi:hypothetical protein [Nocardia jejuensis]|uniref:hypothetical protein n=1 Tax=Nocardia jejuensis TaxID=328049 RepID=UPI000833221D|nr:hypothetical protein [Nocardia jejuensis]